MKRYKKNRVPRTLKKIERVTKTELDRAFHAQLGEVKRLRDEELAALASTRRKEIKDTHDAYLANTREVWSRYDERRDTILKSLGAEQPEAQAA